VRIFDNVSIKICNTRMSVNAATFTQKRHAGAKAAVNLARNVWYRCGDLVVQVRSDAGTRMLRQQYKHTHTNQVKRKWGKWTWVGKPSHDNV